MSVNVLATGCGTATGGRNGHAQTDDWVVSVGLSMPKSMGGPGTPGTTTPEHLFAVGYAACFAGSCESVSRQLNLSPGGIEVKARVGIGQDAKGGFDLTAALDVRVIGLSRADAERLVRAGHAFCPYSKAIKGNVEIAINVTMV
jgi:lipoyl-dependent peroxiredoxin